MNERLLENWLNKADERSFQIPFCYSLMAEGFKVVHSTRHCGIEMGKDIIAISPDGVPIVYQLKSFGGKKVSLSYWENNFVRQITSMIELSVIHPSISIKDKHLSYIVITGSLEEETIRWIDDYNREKEDYKQINVIVMGDLIGRFMELLKEFWPDDPDQLMIYLDLYLKSGKENLDKKRFCHLIYKLLPFAPQDKPSIRKCIRSISNCSLVCSSLLSSFSRENNHLNVFEGWTIFLIYILALLEKWKFKIDDYENEIVLINDVIYTTLQNLCEELIHRDNLLEGDVVIDSLMDFKRIRITQLMGLMSLYGLWTKSINDKSNPEHSEFIRKFCLENEKNLLLWGEYATPQFLVFYFYFRIIKTTPAADMLLARMINAIAKNNGCNDSCGIPNPYYEPDEIFQYIIHINDISLSGKELDETFLGSSYSLESIIHLFVRSNWKQLMKSIWPSTTKISRISFKADKLWMNYLYLNKTGTIQTLLPSFTQSWEKLKKESNESNGDEVPKLLKNYPILYLCFILTMPHRLNSSGIRWVQTELEKRKIC